MAVVDMEVDASFLRRILLDTQVCLSLCILLTVKVNFERSVQYLKKKQLEQSFHVQTMDSVSYSQSKQF